MKTQIMSATVFLFLFLVAGVSSAADRTWNGGGAEAYWSLANNWGGTAPEAGDALFFGGSAKLANTNDVEDGTSFTGIIFNSGAGAFVLGGNAITLDGNVSNLSTSVKTLNLPITLSGDRMIYGSNVAFTVNGVLSGPGGLTANVTNSTLTLTASNTYEGVTYVTNGALVMSHAYALGSTNAHTMVYGRQHGRIQFGGGLEIYEPFTLNGQRPGYGQTLTCSGGSNTLWGKITKVNEIRVGVSGGSTLVFAGGIHTPAGGGDVILNPGGGTVIFREVPINLGTGALYLDQGGLISIAVAGNTWGDTRAAGSGGTIRADVTNALPATTKLYVGAGHSANGNFDLNGYDQTASQLLTDTVNAGTRTVTSSKPAALTLNQSANTLYNGILTGMVRLIKNGTGSILFTNGISTTTGDLIVNTGTVVIAQSAGFNANTNTVVNGGILELRTQTALWDNTRLYVADGAKVRIGAGLKDTVGQLFINGVQQARGTYGTTASGALFPNDTHFDGTGQLNVLSGPAVTPVTYTWDAEGSEDTLFSTAANWTDDAVPLFDGTTHAVFGLGGSTATVDVAAGLYGMAFNRDGNFTLAAGAGVLTNGAGGILAVAPNATARTYAIAEDMVLSDHQTWDAGTNNFGMTTLNLSGSIDDVLVPCDITKAGFGTVNLYGDNTFDGAVIVSNGTLRVFHSNALGSTNGATIVNGLAGCTLCLSGNLNLEEPLVLNGERNNAGTLRIDSGSNTLSGPVTVLSQVRLVIYTGALVVKGGVYVGAGDPGGSLVINSGTATHFYEKPVLIGQKTFYTDSGGLTTLGISGNAWGDTLVANGTLRCDVADALPPTASLRLGIGYAPSGTLSLNGNDQTCSMLYAGTTNAGTRTVTSPVPATLTVNQSAASEFDGRFTGAVSLVKLGAGNLTLTNATTTTTGSITVNEGTLTVANAYTFGDNATNIVVGGSGTLALATSSGISDNAVVTMPAAGVDTAKISLAAGVNETVGWLLYGEKVQRVGTYGSTASTAQHKDDTRFSGTGVLTVRRDDSGTVIMLK